MKYPTLRRIPAPAAVWTTVLFALSLDLAVPSIAAAQLAPVSVQPSQTTLAASPAGFERLDPLMVIGGAQGDPVVLDTFDAVSGAHFPGRAPVRDLQFLDIEVCGRTEMQSFLPGRARKRTDVETGHAWLELPADGGTLHRYRRRFKTRVRYGYLIARSGQEPRIVFEMLSVGGGDPFVGKVAVSPNGRELLVATVPAAGGDLFQIALDGGKPRGLTASIGPKAWSGDGLWLCPDWGFAVASEGIWRFDRQAGATIEPVPAPNALEWTGQSVISNAGTFAMATDRLSASQRRSWVFGRQGAARLVDSPPAQIEPAGFRPEFEGGPWMAVSDDGIHVGWIEWSPAPGPNLEPFRDVRLARAEPGHPSSLVTEEGLLIDTLTEVGRILFVNPTELVYAAGEPNDPDEGGLENADHFGAKVDSNGAPTIRNLSLSSGATVVPFDAEPSITPAAVFSIPGSRLLIHDDDNERLVLLDLVNGTLTTLDSNVKELTWAEPVGDVYAAAVRRDAQPRPRDILRIDPNASSASERVRTLRMGTPETIYAGASVAGDWLVWTERLIVSTTLHRAHVPSLTVETWQGAGSRAYGPLRLTRDGRVSFSTNGNQAQPRAWSVVGADVIFDHPPGPAYVLP